MTWFTVSKMKVETKEEIADFQSLFEVSSHKSIISLMCRHLSSYHEIILNKGQNESGETGTAK